MRTTAQKYFWRINGTLVLAFLLGVILLQFSGIQTQLGKWTIAWLNNQNQLHFELDHASIDWWNQSLVISKLSVASEEDRRQAIHLDHIELGDWRRVDGVWSFGSMDLYHGHIDLNELRELSNQLASSETANEETFAFALESLDIYDFTLEQRASDTTWTLELDHLSMLNLSLNPDTQGVNLIGLSGRLKGTMLEHTDWANGIEIETLQGQWMGNESSWSWTGGNWKSQLFDLDFSANGHWSSRQLLDIHSDWRWTSGLSILQLSEHHLSPERGDIVRWVESLATSQSLQWDGSFDWNELGNWEIETRQWKGVPLFEAIPAWSIGQDIHLNWTSQGEALIDLTDALMSMRNAPPILQKNWPADNIEAMSKKHKSWRLAWETRDEGYHVELISTGKSHPTPAWINAQWVPSTHHQHARLSFGGLEAPDWLHTSSAWTIEGDGEAEWDSTAFDIQWQSNLSGAGEINGSAHGVRMESANDEPTASWRIDGKLESLNNPWPVVCHWEGQMNENQWKFDSKWTLNGIASPLSATEKPWTMFADAEIRANGKSAHIEDFTLALRNINLLENRKPRAFERLDITGKQTQRNWTVQWHSDLSDGNVTADSDWRSWSRWLEAMKTRSTTSSEKMPVLLAEFSIHRFAPIALLADLPFELENGARLKANNHQHGIELQLTIPAFSWDSFEAKNLLLQADGNVQEFFLNVQCDSLLQNHAPWISNAAWDLHGDTIWYSDLEWQGKEPISTELQWSMHPDQDDLQRIEFSKFQWPYADQVFQLTTARPVLQIASHQGNWSIQSEGLTWKSKDWTIQTGGVLHQSRPSEWALSAEGTSWPDLGTYGFPGWQAQRTQLDLDWHGTLDDWEYGAQLDMDSVTWKNVTVSNLECVLSGDAKSTTFWIEGREDATSTWGGTGQIPHEPTGPLRAQLLLKQVPLGWINSWLPQQSVGLSGSADGELAIQGTRQSPEMNGWIQSNAAEVNIEYLGTSYQLEGRCEIEPDQFSLDQWVVTDEQGHHAKLNGTILHQSFDQWNVDLGLEAAEAIQWMNLKRNQNDLFYGTVHATGDINVFGFSDNLQIEADLKTSAKTQFALPLDGASDASYASFIQFTAPTTEIPALAQEQDLSRIRMDLRVEVTEDAEARIIFDESVGDEINVRTKGTIALGVDDFERFTMDGQLEVVEGDYYFTLQNLINKRFEISPGGTITWFGDPYDAEINLDTKYQVRTDLSGLLLDETDLPGRIPVDLILALEGELMRPEIEFTVSVPDASPQIQAQVEGALINEEELNRQALSLLVLNQFLSPDPITSAIGGTGVQDKSTAFIANQLGHWISQISPEIDIGVDYANDQLSGEQALAVALSTRLMNDRLHIEGAIGTQNLTQVSASDVQLQDMTLSYDLDQHGNFQVTGHTRTNQGLSVPYGTKTQGVGIRLQRDFNRWGDWKLKREKKSNSNNAD